MSDRRFVRARRTAKPAFPSERFAISEALRRDPVYGRLRAGTRHAILIGVLTYANGEGAFWPKVATWAKEANVSSATLKRAIREAEDAGVLIREPYLRPDGRQGSTVYRINLRGTRWITNEPPCATRWLTPEPPCSAGSERDSDGSHERHTSWLTAEPADKVAHTRPTKNGTRNRAKPLNEGAVSDTESQDVARAREEDPLGKTERILAALREAGGADDDIRHRTRAWLEEITDPAEAEFAREVVETFDAVLVEESA